MSFGPDDALLGVVDHVATPDARPPVPITVLTGFLGAGKTTLLNRILEGEHGLRVAVLVNDFGDVNIDAELIDAARDGVISMANGCVCCSIRDDLVEAVLRAIELPERPDYIVLEASGVAEPSSITQTFAMPNLRDRIRLDSITCVLDAEQVFDLPELMELKLWQVACSDLLVLNKVDLVDRAQIDRIRRWIDGRMNRYRLIEAVRCDVPLDALLSAGRFDAVALPEHGVAHVGHDAAASLETWTFETDRLASLEALRTVASRLPVGVYRAKGFVRAVEVPDRPVILQVVGRRIDLSIGDGWGSKRPATTIVAIGAAGATDVAELRTLFGPALTTS